MRVGDTKKVKQTNELFSTTVSMVMVTTGQYHLSAAAGTAYQVNTIYNSSDVRVVGLEQWPEGICSCRDVRGLG